MFSKRALAAVAATALTVVAHHDAGAVDAPVPALATYPVSQVATTTVTAAQAMALGEQATGIGPGSHLLISSAAEPDVVQGCTANFIWEAAESPGTLYLGAAGHCFVPNTRDATHGVDADFDPSGVHVEVCVAECTNGGYSGFTVTGKTAELGPVAYARRNMPLSTAVASGIGWDFGIVEIPAELHGLVRRSMPVFGGPATADAELAQGDITCHYGNAMVVGEVFPTMGRVGIGIGEDVMGTDADGVPEDVFGEDAFLVDVEGTWYAATPGLPGDSGAAFQTCRATETGLLGDAAIGVLTHITPTGIAGTTVERAIEMAGEAGLSLSLQLDA